MPETFDIVLRNGTIVDGSGRPAYVADIAVRGDKICEIGHLPHDLQATTNLDASGYVVAPGFIDIHTHADIALLARPAHLPKIMQGVTTEIFANCGLGFAPITPDALTIQRQYIAGLFGDDGQDGQTDIAISALPDNNSPSTKHRGGSSPAPTNLNPVHPVTWDWRSVADFLTRFEQSGIGANIAYLIPHGAVRVSVMGMEERPASAAELRQMQSMVVQGMEEGAWGLSTGVWYAPMRAADRDELVTLCRAAGFFATHQRDYGDSIFAATEESLAIARQAGAKLQIAHLQMNGPTNADRAGELLRLLDTARQDIDVTCDTYPYTAGSTFIQSLLPSWAVDGGPEAILRRLAADETRKRIMHFLNHASLDSARYNLVGAMSAVNKPFEGTTFAFIAERRQISLGELICCLLEEEELRACFIHHAAHEGNVRDILRWSGQMIGSDGLHLPGKTHPRLYGTFPRVLGYYVRDEQVLSLEAAVHKMTGAPAARIGLPGRGILAIGNAADIVVFDPHTIRDMATFEDPLRFPDGIPYVFVNGIAAKWKDMPTGALAGKVLRRV